MFTRAGTTWSAQGAKLTGSGETGEGEFGASVALSVEGTTTTALIGGPGDSAKVGAAWVFTRASTTWTAQGAKLTGSGETGAGEFGRSVALSVEGTTMTALIGGRRDNSGVGAAWVFTRAGTTWSAQGGKLIGKEEVGAGESTGGKGQFGYSVALSSDGNTALIGGPADISAGSLNAGAAWVFTRSGTTWTQQGAKLTAGGEIDGGEFGASVALSSDGNTALIGGPNDNNGLGAAWVFTRSGSTWTQQGAKLTGSGEIGAAEFGDERGALLRRQHRADRRSERRPLRVGAAWVFTRTGSTWTQQGAKLTGGGETGAANFGGSVALSADGNTALIGGSGDNTVSARHGCSRARARRGASRARSSRQRGDRPAANSAIAWRSPPTATPR